MVDSRIVKLAGILVDHSVSVRKGETIKINFGIEAKELALECFRMILKKGGYPIVNAMVSGFGYVLYKEANADQLARFPKIAYYEAKNIDGVISIFADKNTKELSNIDPRKIAIRGRKMHKISDVILKKKWVGIQYPTDAIAQEAEMSLEEFKDFFFSATNIDWKKESKKQDMLKRILDKGNRVQIIGEDTDISFSIRGRKAVKGDGKHNMPGGEVFIAPVEKSVNGRIRYTYPAIKFGKEVEDIRLEFKDGKVVDAKAGKNEDLLLEMIKTDKGASYLGEFGIGTNYRIKRFTKEIAFDEKIGGTIHLALGMAYKEGGGRNVSAIHWDMIKDLRKNGRIIIDSKVIQEKGRFRL